MKKIKRVFFLLLLCGAALTHEGDEANAQVQFPDSLGVENRGSTLITSSHTVKQACEAMIKGLDTQKTLYILWFGVPNSPKIHTVVVTGYYYDLRSNLIFTIYDPGGKEDTAYKFFNMKKEKLFRYINYNDRIKIKFDNKRILKSYDTVTKK